MYNPTLQGMNEVYDMAAIEKLLNSYTYIVTVHYTGKKSSPGTN